MSVPKIFESEYRFCLILWREEPVSCARLAEISKEELGWARTTTYTVIKRLEERGFIKKEKKSICTTLFTKEEIQNDRVEEMVEKTFEGSLPSFVAAFSKKRKLSEKEIDSLRKLIEDNED